MKIVELRVENVKRLHAVTIRPDGNVVQITGKNGAGKTCVLDAIAYALGGKKAQPRKPIRNGETSAEVIIDLGELVVRRHWTSDENSYVEVKGKDGRKYPSPQSVLNALYDEMVDPLAFTRMDRADQVKVLMRIAGLDFTKLDHDRAAAYDTRTDTNRNCKQLEAQLAGMPEVEAPDEEVSIAKLLEEQGLAQQRMMNHNAAQSDLQQAVNAERSARERVSDAQQAFEIAKLALEDGIAKTVALRDLVECAVLPDIGAINDRVANAESANDRVRRRKARARVSDDLATWTNQSDAYTREIERIDAEKKRRMREADFPVQGVGIDNDGLSVTLNGLPFNQASSAEQLELSVGVGLAGNSKLRVLPIRDGSLLDTAHMQVLAELAEKYDAQLWIERATDGEDVGIVIEDGHVKCAAVAVPAGV